MERDMEPTEFEWDEAKRRSNLVKHGFDFRDAVTVFEGDYLLVPGNTAPHEMRELATAYWNQTWVTIVFTRRGHALRIISFRSARHGERRRYQALRGE